MHSTHGFEEEHNEHDVVDKVYNDIKPPRRPSKWVAELMNMAGDKYKISGMLDSIEYQAAEYIEYLESLVNKYLQEKDAFTGGLQVPHRTNASLFESGQFISHAGLKLNWKIECDAIRPEEWHVLAKMINEYEPQVWQKAIGIPRGGVALGKALDQYSTGNPDDPILIVDDVYTTGTSFKEFIEKEYKGVATLQWCVFARKPTGGRVKALFTMPDKGRHGTNW